MLSSLFVLYTAFTEKTCEATLALLMIDPGLGTRNTASSMFGCLLQHLI